ncbi:DUF2868 domain-containing protein [Achromobacter aloeverae]|uniref:DUF2868 domain-containing protein n=1 Tax=Achromobacter aloeverae TaxID=1750518 RepID=A0A4V1MS57_9BURK|nr:DUF2868 domain-containing protein [Achromobacter aloeverae]RXN90152.1 DUF2868 domain-containing protein [Achromobacter aloeverae]
MPALNTSAISSAPAARAALDDLWLAETVRLREEHWGPVDDAQAVRQARLAPGPLPQRILLRARLLGRQTGLAACLAAWRRAAVIGLVLLLGAGLMAGIGAALGALGDGARAVNVLHALGALLGLHALTFLFWVGASVATPRGAGQGLARLWLWVSRRLARGPDTSLAAQALLGLLARAGGLRWLFGTVSHFVWLLALTAALATLLLVLSTASYRFIWATTLLDPQTFVRLTDVLGWLPARLGFSVPDAALVAASDGTRQLPALAQAQWSMWLIGALVTYGILPRLLAWLLSVFMLRRALAGLRLDPDLPGYAGLASRLAPPADTLDDDAPAPAWQGPRIGHANASAVGVAPTLVGLELAPDLPWPPAALPATVADGGNLDTREQRRRLLDTLAARPAPRLLIVCDARQTPDRGALALIADLSAAAQRTRLWLLGDDDIAAAAPSRAAAWRDRLRAAGVAEEDLLRDAAPALRWLEEGHG